MKKFILSSTGSVLIPIMLAASAIAGIGIYAVKRYQDDLKTVKTVQIKNEFETIMSDIGIILASTDSCTESFRNWNPEDYLERPTVSVYYKATSTAPRVERYRSDINPDTAPKYGASNLKIKYIKMGFRDDPSVGFTDPADPTIGYTNLLIGFHPDGRRLGDVLERRIRLHVKIVSTTDRRIVSCSNGGSADMDDYLSLAGGRMLGNIDMSDGTQIDFQSDKNLKTEIKPMKRSLDEVMKLNPVSYVWRKSEKESFGFIAQDVKEVFPHLVHENYEHGYLALSYFNLTPFLLKAFQEVREENLKLTKSFSELEREHEELKKFLCQKNRKSSLCLSQK